MKLIYTSSTIVEFEKIYQKIFIKIEKRFINPNSYRSLLFLNSQVVNIKTEGKT